MTTAFSLGRFELRPASRELLEDGRAVALGARAFDVLQALVEHRERIVTKHELLDLVWPGVVVEENNLQVQISTLRKILGPRAIATIPGRGYRLTLEESPSRGPVSEATSPLTTIGSEPAAGNPDSPGKVATSLPTRQAALIGREDDARAVEELLAEQGLVSIVGAGGIGKTRLALAVALGQRAAFPDGVKWVDLASINDLDMVPNAIARAVGITGAVERPTVELLVSVLRRSRSLLVLDNCEHVLEPVAQVVDVLLRECQELRFLITSQEPLKLAGEQTYRLGPLAVPREDEPVDERTAAVALFLARALIHDRRLKFDAAALVTVASICRQLDGLPLAIELAAARVPLLGLDGLRARLRERFKAGEALEAATRLVRPDWPPWLRGYLASSTMIYLFMMDDATGALDAAWQQYECCSEGRIIHFLPIALTNVAFCEAALGRYDSAIERLEGVLNQNPQLGVALGHLARTLAFPNGPGDVERALALGREAWPLVRRQYRAIGLLEDMGVAHARRGAPDRAARLIGHARAARAQDGEVERPAFRRVVAAVLEELRARHGQSQVDGWCAEGAALNDDEAASLAFGPATSDPRRPVA